MDIIGLLIFAQALQADENWKGRMVEFERALHDLEAKVPFWGCWWRRGRAGTKVTCAGAAANQRGRSTSADSALPPLV